MNCPNCGAANRDTAKFCSDCGARLIEANKATLSQETGPAQTSLDNSSKDVEIIITSPKKGLSRRTKIVASAALAVIALLIVAGASLSMGSNGSSSGANSNNASNLGPSGNGNETPQIQAPGEVDQTGDIAPSQLNNSSSDQTTSSQTTPDPTLGTSTSSNTPSEKSSTIKVVINEVEPNPAGTDTGNEWVELYNSGGIAVDLTGWSLTTTHNRLATLPLSGTIGPGQYMVFHFSKQSVDNQGDSVVLLDSHGKEVDRTPISDDSASDSRTWQRVPDGASDWQFMEGTTGTSNGSPIVDPTPSQSQNSKPTPSPEPAPSPAPTPAPIPESTPPAPSFTIISGASTSAVIVSLHQEFHDYVTFTESGFNATSLKITETITTQNGSAINAADFLGNGYVQVVDGKTAQIGDKSMYMTSFSQASDNTVVGTCYMGAYDNIPPGQYTIDVMNMNFPPGLYTVTVSLSP